MPKELWINLPVKDIKKSKEFFTKIGFPFNPSHNDRDDMASLVIGEKKVIVMLFPESTIKEFARTNISDTNKGTEVLLSIDAASREEVDEIAKKAKEAGGKIYAEPSEIDGWMYGCGFSDLDGHRWNSLYMDMDKMPK